MTERAYSAIRYYAGIYFKIGGVLRDLTAYLDKPTLNNMKAELTTVEGFLGDILNDTDKGEMKKVLRGGWPGRYWPELFHLEKRDADMWADWMLTQTSKPAIVIRKRVDEFSAILAQLNNITKEIAYHVGAVLPIDADGLEQFFKPTFVQSDRWPETLAAFRRFRELNPNGIETAVVYRGLNRMGLNGWRQQDKFQPGLIRFYQAIGIAAPKSIPRDTDCMDWIEERDKDGNRSKILMQPFKSLK